MMILVVIFELNFVLLDNFSVVVVVNNFKPLLFSNKVTLTLCIRLINKQRPLAKSYVVCANDIFVHSFRHELILVVN